MTLLLWLVGCALCSAQDASDLAWIHPHPMPAAPVVDGMVVGHAGSWILAGGETEDGPSARTWWLDGETWVAGPDLPEPRAGATAVSTSRGVILVGGRDGDGAFNRTLTVLQSDGEELFVSSRLDPARPEPGPTLGPLPASIEPLRATELDGTLWILGREPVAGWTRLHELPLTGEASWTAHPRALHGPERIGPIVRQGDGRRTQAWWIGTNAQDGSEVELWSAKDVDRAQREPSEDDARPSASVHRGSTESVSPIDHHFALPLGLHHIAIVPPDRTDAPLLAYHTVTEQWLEIPHPRELTSVVAMGTSVDGRTLAVTPNGTYRLDLASPEGGFSGLDYAVLVLYLAALVAMGVVIGRRGGDADHFFLGGRRIPWWAAGMSIFGTQLSAITFMAIPALVYRTDWVYFLGSMMIVAVAPLVVRVYLPAFRKHPVTSAYAILERRFDSRVRKVASASFLAMQIGRMGIVLYLPALALSTVTGVGIVPCIITMGVLATLYTVLGGIEAVIWTDVLQVVVLLGGALYSLILILGQVPDDWVSTASQAGKWDLVQWNPSLATTGLFVVIVGRFFDALPSYTADQTVVQRYLTTADTRKAARSVWTNAALTIPATLLFFTLGTALWAFYRTFPERMHPGIGRDDILPWFVAHELPGGVAGLVVAGLFAASMSSLDSSLNSMATALTTDFRRLEDDDLRLRRARRLTWFLGALGTTAALVMVALGSTSMWDQWSKVVGLFGGGLAGLFILALSRRRISTPAALVGFAGSAAVLFVVRTSTSLHFFLYAGVGVVSCVLLARIAALMLPLPAAGPRRASP